MPAKTKTDLITTTEKEFKKLCVLIESIDVDTAMAKQDEDISIKDIIAHRAHWIGLFLGWYADGRAGKEVYFPAKGFKWNELKRYNAELRARQTNLSWSDAVARLTLRHEELMSFLQMHSDQDLYGASMQGAKNDWTPGRWAEAAGASHYRSASKFLRRVLK